MSEAGTDMMVDDVPNETGATEERLWENSLTITECLFEMLVLNQKIKPVRKSKNLRWDISGNHVAF